MPSSFRGSVTTDAFSPLTHLWNFVTELEPGVPCDQIHCVYSSQSQDLSLFSGRGKYGGGAFLGLSLCSSYSMGGYLCLSSLVWTLGTGVSHRLMLAAS